MDTRKPAAYGQCPHRAGRPAQNQMMRPQAPAVQRASAAALSQPKPATASTLKPAAQIKPAAQPMPKLQPPPPPPPPPAQPKRAYLSAWAKEFTVTAESGKRAPLPLETQRAQGGMALGHAGVTVQEDGYYMLLWELGVAGTNGGEATLQLGINDAASQLTYALHPGYDSGQQITWLSAGDTLGLFAQTADEKAEVNCGSAQFTVIRLG